VTALRAIAITALTAFCAACSKPTPSPPTVNPGDPVTVTGHENLACDQGASSLAELDGVGHYIYVNGQKQPYGGVACRAGATAGSFICQAPLPKMNPGTRSLQLTSFYQTTPDNESEKSGSLQLIVQGIVGGATEMINSGEPHSSVPSTASLKADAWPTGLLKVADGLDRPSDLAFTPDSRLWIAEQNGRVRVVRDGTLVPDAALTLDHRLTDRLVSVTADPHFATNHFMFAIYTERSRSGHSFVIARFREAADTLADRIVILDNVPASPDARATLRFGLDGKLYAALDDGGDARLAEDPASFNGKVLRLNPDGTTPDDAPRKSPIASAGPASPRGLAWHRATARLWAADRFTVGGVRWTSSPESVAVLQDDLFVGSETGLTRAQIQRASAPRLGAIHDVLRNVSIRAVATAPDGAVYVATATAIGRLQ
jgi:hypothetical protein